MTYELFGVKGPEPRVYQSAGGSAIWELHRPVDFPCTVNGKALTASIAKAEDDGTKWLYHVRFSDGYTGVFTIDRKKKCIVEKYQSNPSHYLKAVETDIRVIYQFLPFRPQPFCLLVDAGSEKVKVWAKPQESGSWFVFYKENFHFFVHLFSGKWQHEPLDNIAGTCVVPEIVDAVLERLNKTTKFSLAPTS